jgi:hypothetical protein
MATHIKVRGMPQNVTAPPRLYIPPDAMYSASFSAWQAFIPDGSESQLD